MDGPDFLGDLRHSLAKRDAAARGDEVMLMRVRLAEMRGKYINHHHLCVETWDALSFVPLTRVLMLRL